MHSLVVIAALMLLAVCQLWPSRLCCSRQTAGRHAESLLQTTVTAGRICGSDMPTSRLIGSP